MSMDKQHRYQPAGPATFDQNGWNAHYATYRRDPIMQLLRGIGWVLFIVVVSLVCGIISYVGLEYLL